MSGGKRTVYVRVGTDKVPVEIDEKTTAGDIKRKLGRTDMILTVNGNTVADSDKILPLLTEGENYIRLMPESPVGSSSLFFTGEKRLKQEETLLREIGFVPTGARRFSGFVRAGSRIVKMHVYLPSTFPYSRPIITIDDPYFLGKHPCIMQRDYGIEVHFHDEDWKPWMHAADLAVQAIAFLKSVEKRCGRWIPEELISLLRLAGSLRGI